MILSFIPLICFFLLACAGLHKLPHRKAFVPARVFLILILVILVVFIAVLILIHHGVIPGLPAAG